ncbi:TOM13-domain-containing protein [Aaosphaeria arxii CBS 175.79]|uniref:TOM13-domain-containing protein n=1 Tax=Aaosphaeria arxii CBS 175.79 TaxID=1450172 RepID=A0A6A5Y6Q7_9PLEO|nr:TOM13-domain-containing protein [Aaosphaeria arxii CBS 175.79]KAF2021242.1 TOM13-domain-containing protein [Aaosphaeria arxii CBS 175.79]
MADLDQPTPLTSSSLTLPSDSETYLHSPPASPSPAPSTTTSSSPLILYKPPTLWGLLRGAAINLLLPFVNGLMLGFGELIAHEAAFRLGWSGTKIFPVHRSGAHSLGPGVEARPDPVERKRRSGQELDMYTALE